MHPPKDLRPVLVAILAAGVRQADVARNLHVSRACISDAAKPSNKPWMPSYATGVALLAMYSDLDRRALLTEAEQANA